MPHKEQLIKLCLEKADLAIKAAKDNLNLKNLETAYNRTYYAIFYATLALAYKEGFATSKHKQLMGWFNKKFIYEEKIFDENMLNIYKDAFLKRQKGDYELIFMVDEKDLEKLLDKSIFFVEEIKKYLLMGKQQKACPDKENP